MNQAAIPGQASKDRLKLCPCIRGRLANLLAEAKQIGLELVLIETWRDLERQHYYRKIGVSRTLKSKHLPQPPNDLSLAFDIAPKVYLTLKNWAPGAPLWHQLIGMATRLGLEAGGLWSKFKDYPHFALRECECPVKDPA